jgi:hypothetical protein
VASRVECNIVELNYNPLQPFLDPIQATNILGNSQDEPLVHFKLTHLVQSGEHFLNILSCFYQQVEPLEPLPVFERRLWREDEADQSFLLLMKQQSGAKPRPKIF